MAHCFNGCPHLNKELGYCINPAFNGRGYKLNRDGSDFVKICKLRGYKTESKLSNDNCNPKCRFLSTDYGIGVCLKREFQRNCKLKKDENGNYIRICKDGVDVKKTNKYKAKKVIVDGITYDSELEYQRYCELRLLEKAGQIKKLQYHKRYILIEKNENGREIAYEADFVYEKDGKTIVEDTKSEPTKTRLYALKKRLMLEKFGIKITEYIK